VINSLGGEQDNVVFMGRRSFRMEIAGEARSNDMAIPRRASGVPTEKIFEADRGREEWTAKAAAALQPARLRANGTSVIALCVTTFVLGIALTLTLYGRQVPRRASAATTAALTVTAAPATVPTPTPAPTMIVQQMPIAAPTDAEILAGFAFEPARRPLAKPARAARPRPVRALRPTTSAEEAASADPFADPAPAAKPAAKRWVDPFAE
jgi:hypothetical protein